MRAVRRELDGVDVHEPPPEVPLGAPPEVGPVGGLGAVSARRTGDLLQVCDFVRALGPALQLGGEGGVAYTASELAAELSVTSGAEPPARLADLRVDRLISAAATELGRTGRALGRLARRPQTGQLHHYYAQAAGALAVLALFLILVR